MKPINLTERRIECLRWLARLQEPVYVCAIANNCLPRPDCGGRPLGYWPQMATRSGAGYARPLAEAGLVRCRHADHGWGMVEITQEGRHVLSAIDRDDGSLEQWLAHAQGLASSKGYYWWQRRARRRRTPA